MFMDCWQAGRNFKTHELALNGLILTSHLLTGGDTEEVLFATDE